MNNHTIDSIVNTIMFSRKVKDVILGFTNKLNDEGTLGLFINPEKLDVLMKEFRKRNILTGNYAWIDFSSEYLVQDFNSELIHCFAGLFYSSNAFTEEEMLNVLEASIPVLEKPEGAHQLYYWLFNYASKVSKIFIQALECYYAVHPEEETNYMPYVTAAIPGVVKAKPECTVWAITKKRTFDKIFWGNISNELPFETCYKSIFNDVTVTASGYSKDQIFREVNHLFRLMMIDEVFTQLTKARERTALNISDKIAYILLRRTTFVYALFVKAFLWVLMEDKSRAQAMNEIKDTNVATSAYNGNRFGNLPS